MKRSSRQFVGISFSLFLTVIAIGQNPFDIKTPGKKQEKQVINNTTTPPQSKPADSKPVQAPVQTPAENKITPPVNTSVQQQPGQSPAGTPASSGNPFDIKPGTGSQSGTVIQNQPNPSATNQNQSPSSNNATQEIKPTAPLINPDGVNNPFNIKPGTDPSTPSTPGKTAPTLVAPDLTDIKNQLEDFKTSTIKTEGSISKNTWFVIYIFLVLLAGIAINFNRSYPLALMKATYNQNQMRILFKDAFKGNHTFIFGILYFLFIVNAGIFLYQSFLIFNIAKISLLFAIFIVFITYFVRHLVLFVMGVIFPMTKEASLFSYTIGIYNLALGIALLFLNSALLFVDPETGKMLIFSGLSIVLVLYVLRQVRGLLSNVPSIISAKFHFIIYLCTVEIAPWLLLSGILLK